MRRWLRTLMAFAGGALFGTLSVGSFVCAVGLGFWLTQQIAPSQALDQPQHQLRFVLK